VRADSLKKAMATIGRNMYRQVNRSLISSEDRDEALTRITTSTEYAAFADADFVIESATEKEDVKRSIFKLLTPNLKPACLLASNTSRSRSRGWVPQPTGRGKVHRYALRTGAGDEAGGDHPRHRHR
jgi:3-hydroxyacyl-CoA dehydrogenase